MSKTILFFPGQGSQYVGMGKELAESHSGAARLLEEANDVLGFAFDRLLFEGPAEELNQTQNTQPALYLVSIMAMELLKEKGISFDMAAGHSLGEYSALCAAGVFSFAEGLRLVRLRGELMAQAGVKQPGAMSAVLGLEAGKLQEVLAQASQAGPVVAANYNSPVQIVISGAVAAVARAGELCQAAGAKRVVPLPVSGAFHSPLMEFALPGLSVGLDKASFGNPSVPIITNVEAAPCSDPARLKELLVKQLTSPVRWVETVQRAKADGCDQGYEVGAGKVLMGLARSIDRDLKVTPIEKPGDLA